MIPLRLSALPGSALVVLALSACAPPAAGPVGTPAPDPAALARTVAAATTPAAPLQATFAWTLDEAGSRVSGRGVARAEAPERLRLDLFGSRGETYLSAALVGDEFRLPPGAAPGIELPSPALLWAALGVARPPAAAVLESASTTEEEVILRYGLGGEDFEFRAATDADTLLLSRVERIGPSGVIESVRLERAGDGDLSRTRYRNWAAYRDLELNFESIENVAPFPASIWTPGGAAR